MSTLEQSWARARVAVEVVFGILAALIFGSEPIHRALLNLAFLDLLAAVVHNAVIGELQSGRLFVRGLARKVLMFVALRAMGYLGSLPGLPEVPVAGHLAGAFCVHEGISILEHCSAGFWLPGFMKRWLAVVRRAQEDETAAVPEVPAP